MLLFFIYFFYQTSGVDQGFSRHMFMHSFHIGDNVKEWGCIQRLQLNMILLEFICKLTWHFKKHNLLGFALNSFKQSVISISELLH